MLTIIVSKKRINMFTVLVFPLFYTSETLQNRNWGAGQIKKKQLVVERLIRSLLFCSAWAFQIRNAIFKKKSYPSPTCFSNIISTSESMLYAIVQLLI